MGKILGIDLGISSVGYGIVEEDTYDIIDYGVRLFEEGTADGNVKRRTLRSGRRLRSRKKNRINAIKYILYNNGIIDSVDFEPLLNVYELRVKGLTSKLKGIELANVLVNIAKHRGSSLEIAVDEDDKEANTLASALTNNSNFLYRNNKYICEFLLDKLNNGETIRNTDNVFRTVDYEKEVRKILSNQGLSDELNEKIVSIITRRRHFSEGPGSKDFPTKYGSYRVVYENGMEIVKHVNLIEEMRGKCSIFQNEPRIAKFTYTACLFNMLNDLNNLKIDNSIKLSSDQKKELITNYIEPKGKLSISNLVKYLGVSEDRISGFRKSSAGKNILTTFDGYVKLLKIHPFNEDFNSNAIDEIIEILTKTMVVEERVSELEKLHLELSSSEILSIANLTKINGYHSLSKKAMDLIIPELIDTEKNQMQIISENKIGINKEKYFGPNIPFDTSAILSPVTKRVHIQALKLINELRKNYGEFSSIVIETTREKNSKEEKKSIQEQNRRLEEQKKRSEELLLEIGKNPYNYNTLTKLKIKLYKEQDGKTIYAGLPIDLDVLLNDPTAYQIEHIIPYSISFDNSLNNKALASEKENQDKNKRTPWEYFSSGKVSECKGSISTWNQFETFVNNMNITKVKKQNLLNQTNVSKFNNMEEFVARNLNDTSYAIRTVMNTMKKYFNDNDISTNVFTVKGKFTSSFRGRVGLNKDRDKFIHHAIDALIIAGSKNQSVFNNAYQLFSTKDGITYMKETGEQFDYTQDPFEDQRFLSYLSSLKRINGSPRDFSIQVDRKTNRQFADQTIYSTRNVDGEDYIVGKFKDIYGKDGESLKNLFDNGKSNTLLMYKNDFKTYELLEKIYIEYKSEKNPFLKYKEEYGPIRKYSKNGKGPVISQIKYLDSKIGNFYDISKNYNLENSKKKVILLSITTYRTDIYISPKGQYKLLSVRRIHVKQKNNKNYIDENEYNELKIKNRISKDDKFLFSLNRNDVVNILSRKDFDSSNKEKLYRFISVNDEKRSKIELRSIEKKDEDRITITIGKNIIKFEKYNVSPAGKWSKVVSEDLKLEW